MSPDKLALAKSATKLCKNNCACLEKTKDNKFPRCQQQSLDGHNIIFLEKQQVQECPYGLKFGYASICRCPLRYAMVSEAAPNDPV
jgi:hypothetical protein